MSARQQMLNGPGRPTPLRTFSLGHSAQQQRSKLPLSPPETERTTLTRNVDYESPETERVKEDVSIRNLRRAPSIQYNHGGSVAGRAHSQRASRWLIVVTPPTTLNSEPVLGHTLAMGPPGRYQSGILMPLFPTMYGQLAAIAREFSLPSIAGVCLYLHVPESNIGINPRISDEAWQLLWSPYFTTEEAATPVQSGPPICGRIEFDVDVRKARWYELWVNGQERPIVLDASIPPSVAHTMRGWYPEHREVVHGDIEPSSEQHSTSRKSKHVPRPLALSGNYENLHRTPQKYRTVVSHDNDGAEFTAPKHAPKRLSPVTQATEASVKQRDLDILVRNWRATTPQAPVIPGVNLAGESVPDTYDLPLFSEIDMDDYDWAVSSAGPPSNWLRSPAFVAPLPSVDLFGRMVGSVALTPSVATSFGPDDSIATPTGSNVSRYPSPDIAGRLIDDSPPTPTTATSWGAPSVWPATPDSVYRVRTPDIGERMDEDAALTPTTATSWGAPEVWPPSPMEVTRSSTPDIGERTFSSEIEPYQLVWPFFEANKTRASEFVWPFFEPDGSEPCDFVWPFFEPNATEPCEFVWPFLSIGGGSIRNDKIVVEQTYRVGKIRSSSQKEVKPAPLRSEATPSSFVWPFFQAESSIPRSISVALSGVYPDLCIYAHVYPNLTIYPECSDPSAAYSNLQKSRSSGQTFARHAYPKPLTTSTTTSVEASGSTGYPYFNLYPPVYPFVTPYPQSQDLSLTVPKKSDAPASIGSVGLAPCYPEFDLYPAGYPSLVIYPAIKLGNATTEHKNKLAAAASVQSLNLAPGYPMMNIYPPVYPFLEIYPPFEAPKPFSSTKKTSQELQINVKLGSYYPELVIYPPVYPIMDIYPSFKVPQVESEVAKVEPILATPLFFYPHLTIYPSTYPYLDIYPTVHHDTKQLNKLPSLSHTLHSQLPSFYPFLEIYPSQYPHLQIYPMAKAPAVHRLQQPNHSYTLNSQLPSFYPFLDIYPPQYPHLQIYPIATRPSTSHIDAEKSMLMSAPAASVRLPALYPAFNLYPSEYPHLDIYPSIPAQSPEPMMNRKSHAQSISIRISENATLMNNQPLSPRQRVRRSSNQWTASGFIIPAARLRRGSVNKSDKCETPVPTHVRKVAARPLLRHRKSHTDLYNEVKDQVMALVEAKAGRQEPDLSLLILPHTTTRKLSSARVDGVVASSLSRSKSVTTSAPPVPSLPSGLRHKLSLSSSKAKYSLLSAVGVSAFTVASAVSGGEAT
ncbi:hypothetical protein FRC14_003463 [Serendipita sp. 396]|nr:hypothetical protein FRC14_003463 [Serendipita sp. 396]KAG8787596.1 hypothetical protein FRC15_008845 [Serendipita sp. 397]KAG8803336.1 hypothetical protein FRC16_006081 [Serendipita sp. 398]KAG8827104.1 hypothetical protein FRC19_005532 [Serendipita sp. 401]KAG8858483.1 hypothetical protein FRB91_009706 [Serendipita sp. 411]KAG8876226.1 hypothetical protein FRC20_002198 [Serendipita sp. 405]KAG9056508.1 hypothetical protein FS842_010475 [Serendipita sp. 407]